jgi:hypothetical protein
MSSSPQQTYENLAIDLNLGGPRSRRRTLARASGPDIGTRNSSCFSLLVKVTVLGLRLSLTNFKLTRTATPGNSHGDTACKPAGPGPRPETRLAGYKRNRAIQHNQPAGSGVLELRLPRRTTGSNHSEQHRLKFGFSQAPRALAHPSPDSETRLA